MLFRSDIRQKAEESTLTERNSILEKTKQESAQLIENAKREIDLDVKQAKNDLLAEVGKISIGLSEKILERNLNDSDQSKLITDYVEKIKN